MFSSFLVREQERAFLYRNGRLAAYLRPGRHRLFAPFVTQQVETLSFKSPWMEWKPGYERVMPSDEAALLDVTADHLGLLSQDGRPSTVLLPGKYWLWQVAAKAEVQLVDMRPLKPGVPEAFWPLIAEKYLTQILVFPYENVLLYENGSFHELLCEGRHVLSAWNRKLEVVRVDLREQELQVIGQELMTQDKATLRLNLLMKYRIVDPLLSVQSVTVLRDALYAEMQMAARQAVASVPVDQLLERRVEQAQQMTESVKERAAAWGVEVLRMDIKDVVLPGDMKNLLNQVIEAEKKAAAQVIMRREEVAATRSLANTARMLENNPTLLRLKELEAWKDIAATVGSLTVVTNGDLAGRVVLPLANPAAPVRTGQEPGR